MQVAYEDTGTAVVYHLDGNLENLTVAAFRAALATLEPGRPVVFDLAGVTFIDSAGLGALIGAVRRAREGGGDAAVCGPRPSVDRALQLVGLPRVVPVVRDLEEAARYFAASRVA